MVSTKTTTVVSLAAISGLIQMGPAPQAIVAAIVGGAVAGAIGGGAALCDRYCPGPNPSRRGLNYVRYIMGRSLPPGVSQYDIDQCTSEINSQKASGVSVEISSVNAGTVNVDNVPPACMDLADVLTGDPAQAGGPVPTPMSSSSLQYTGLTTQDRQNLADALGSQY